MFKNSQPALLCSHMEFYIKSLELYLKPGYSVIRTEGQDVDNVSSDTILIDIKCLDDCPDIMELNNMLHKRLSLKKRSERAVDYKVLAICCLASRGYAINHNSISGVLEKEMSKIWSTLERSKVSSSVKLRPWVSKNLSSRSYEGFSGAVGAGGAVVAPETLASSSRVDKTTRALLISNLKVDLVVGTSFTVRGAMVTDAKLLHAVRVCAGEAMPQFEGLTH